MADKTTTEQREALRNRLAVCQCSQRGASGFTDNDGVAHWTCCQCGFRYESPPRVDRKLALALLDDVASLAKERDAVLARAIAAENHLEDRIATLTRDRDTHKRDLDAVARALHPHWPEGARKTYAPEQLPAMVVRLTGEWNALTRERDAALARACAAESRISRAIDYAGGRWSEWGQRALGVIDILEGGDG